MITGGTGFFGRQFVSDIMQDSNFTRVCIYSRNEHAQAEMRHRFLDDPRLRWFIGDVRDPGRLRRAAASVDVVVHAAALKRVEVGRYNPDEMVRTNVSGAENVIEACMEAGVSKAVLVSTDKAVEPVNTYGKTKAVAEDLFLNANEMSPKGSTRFAVARYGNVWGSTGSVVPTWQGLIQHGAASVPVTDPDCTRFFMRAEQASHLILNLIQDMKGGEVAVPDLPAYRLGDLAEAMNTQPRVTGLPEWEKRHESMRIGETSEHAERMSVDELRGELEAAGYKAREAA